MYVATSPSFKLVVPLILTVAPASGVSGIPGGVTGGVGSLASTIVVVTDEAVADTATASNCAPVAPLILAVYVSPLSANASSVVTTVKSADVSPAGIVTFSVTAT